MAARPYRTGNKGPLGINELDGLRGLPTPADVGVLGSVSDGRPFVDGAVDGARAIPERRDGVAIEEDMERPRAEIVRCLADTDPDALGGAGGASALDVLGEVDSVGLCAEVVVG